jgi:hypothetical protein
VATTTRARGLSRAAAALILALAVGVPTAQAATRAQRVHSRDGATYRRARTSTQAPAAPLGGQPCRQFAGDNVAASKCLLAQPLNQIDPVFGSLAAGPMPGWDKPAKGMFRCVWADACGSSASVELLNTVIPRLWGGKTFFTDKNGGWLWNRAAPLENPAISGPLNGNTGVIIGNVQYAPSYLDGKRAVTVTYKGIPDAPIAVDNMQVVSGAPDDCRTFQPKLWLCNAWYDFRPAAAPQRWAVFSLDFTNGA